MNDWENWAQGLSDFMEGAARITEQWAEETLQKTVEVADTLTDEIEKQIGPTLDQWTEEFYQAVEPLETKLDEEAERLSEEFSAFMMPLVTPLADSLEAWFESIATPLNQTIDPLANEHTACIGCRHYYGQAHGGNMLVCAMYPYGPDQEKCPDWESTWDKSSKSG
ncbi:MAG: hypothetical protein AAGE59_34655 [Cyanobacteria bacterium P01_F01_bin.86]